MGNKGYVTFTLEYNFKYLISFAVGHLEAGKSSNQERIETLRQILERKINNKQSHNKFKNSDYWLILGDLNFRIETSFDSSFRMIQNKEYRDLIRYDQFYVYCKREKDLALAKEGEINFSPTYKYVPGSNNYINDSDNIRISSYTDRILFCNKIGITNISYNSIPTVIYSDHRPVQGCYEVYVFENGYNNNNNMNICKFKLE